MLRIAFLLLVVIFSSVVAQADPVVVIGSGSNSSGGTGFNFAFQNSSGSIAMNFSTLLTVNPIGSHAQPGAPFFLNFRGTGLDVVGTLVADGVSYPAIGNIIIVAAPVLAPSSFIAGPFHIFTSFIFTGAVVGFDRPDFANELIRYSLIGNGVLDATVISNGDPQAPVYTVTHVTYTLTTPEPTTMLLLGSGLAGLVVLVRKRIGY